MGYGGAEKQTVALAERMAAKGHVVTLVVLKHASEEWPVQLPVLRLNMDKQLASVFRHVRFVRRFLRVFGADVIHSHTYPANTFGRLLSIHFNKSAARPKLLNTIHNVYEGGWLRMLVYRISSPLTDGVTAVSNAAAERYMCIGAVPRAKMRVLTNGIDCEAFQPDRERRKRTRCAMNAGDSFAWLAIGRLAPAKDYPNLLRAFAIVRRNQPRARLWIAGEGSVADLDLECSRDLHSIFSEDMAMDFLGLRRDVADLLDAADGFVLSSAWEGMPLVVGEAMAMEKVVVATDVGGVRELVGNAGLTVTARDSGALANAMEHVMEMTDFERKAMGRAARKRIQSSFSMEAKAAEWDEFYASVVSRGRA